MQLFHKKTTALEILSNSAKEPLLQAQSEGKCEIFHDHTRLAAVLEGDHQWASYFPATVQNPEPLQMPGFPSETNQFHQRPPHRSSGSQEPNCEQVLKPQKKLDMENMFETPCAWLCKWLSKFWDKNSGPVGERVSPGGPFSAGTSAW